MAKQVQLKSAVTDADVAAFLATIEPEALRNDSLELVRLFTEITGQPARMWGSSIIGFGEYTYYRANGHQGKYLATGFSPRKSGPTVYIMPGYQDYSAILAKLGPHKLGKSCLYLKSLATIDTAVLRQLIEQGLKDLAETHATNYA